jgi:hypothetical protein
MTEWIKEPTLVECDCQVLITVVESSTVESAQWSDLIIGIKIVAQMLPTCNFHHIRREGNMVAHRLAQHAMRNDECVVR